MTPPWPLSLTQYISKSEGTTGPTVYYLNVTIQCKSDVQCSLSNKPKMALSSVSNGSQCKCLRRVLLLLCGCFYINPTHPQMRDKPYDFKYCSTRKNFNIFVLGPKHIGVYVLSSVNSYRKGDIDIILRLYFLTYIHSTIYILFYIPQLFCFTKVKKLA